MSLKFKIRELRNILINLIEIFLLISLIGLIIIVFTIIFILYYCIKNERSEMECEIYEEIDNELDDILYDNELLHNHETLLDFINLENHSFKIKKELVKK